MLCHRTLSYPVVSIEVKLLTVRSITQEILHLSLLVLLLLLFYVSLSKNAFLRCQHLFLRRKRMQRYNLFLELANFFQVFLGQTEKFSHFMTNQEILTLLYFINTVKLQG